MAEESRCTRFHTTVRLTKGGFKELNGPRFLKMKGVTYMSGVLDSGAFAVLVIGFLLGLKHATDADHVVAGIRMYYAAQYCHDRML